MDTDDQRSRFAAGEQHRGKSHAVRMLRMLGTQRLEHVAAVVLGGIESVTVGGAHVEQHALTAGAHGGER